MKILLISRLIVSFIAPHLKEFLILFCLVVEDLYNDGTRGGNGSDYLTCEGSPCDAPFPGVPLTTRQPTEYSWMSGNPTPLMKIGQSLLCTGSSTQDTICLNHMATCPNILQRPHRVHIQLK